jgi:hypothetical protein
MSLLERSLVCFDGIGASMVSLLSAVIDKRLEITICDWFHFSGTSVNRKALR